MRIVMVSGPPSMACGVADYTAQLVEALRQIGVEVYLVSQSEWGLSQAKKLRTQIQRLSPDLIHLQYPAAVYGRGLAPQTVLLGRWPVVITLHEFSQVHPLRRMASLPFSLAQYLIFTNPHEQAAMVRQVPWIKTKSSIIALGSSVPFLPTSGYTDPQTGVYFGLIRNNKGLEDFIELARLAQPFGYRFSILGSCQIGAESYFEQIHQGSRFLSNLTWVLGLPAQQVAQRLGQSGFAYLPFPDGASERRTSLLAALGNGLPVITTRGSHTPPELTGAVSFVTTPSEALHLLENWRVQPEAKQLLRSNAARYIKRFDWRYVAEAHLEVYRKLRR